MSDCVHHYVHVERSIFVCNKCNKIISIYKNIVTPVKNFTKTVKVTNPIQFSATIPQGTQKVFQNKKQYDKFGKPDINYVDAMQPRSS